MIIGGIAAIPYGVPQATFDLHILIEATINNAQKLLDALIDAKFGIASMTSAQGLVKTEITIFEDRVRVDVQTSTPGIDFERAWRNCQVMGYHGQELYVVLKEDLVASKRAAGRKVDLEDVRLLEIDNWNQQL